MDLMNILEQADKAHSDDEASRRKNKRSHDESNSDSEPIVVKRHKAQPPEIKDLDDLIAFGIFYDRDADYGFDASKLADIVVPLMELSELEGMADVKSAIVKQVLYLLQGFHTKDDFLHTVITGHPGTGKTVLANILAKIYSGLGFLPSATLTIKRPADFISQWIGGTTTKTKEILDKCIGGVLLIDEAYTLGRKEDEKDAYAGECLNTLNQYLSEYRDKFVCVIAGYRDALDKKFFPINEGLRRRFPWWYHIDDYSTDSMGKIFRAQVQKLGWDLNEEAAGYITGRFKDGLPLENFGGDTEVMFTKCKICYAQRMLGHPHDRVLTLSDVKTGLELYLKGKPTDKKDSGPPPGMYL